MAWLRLLRIAALPSALSNILIGYLLVHQSWQPPIALAWLLLSSACLYCAGMVLNDVYDLKVDQKERPSRPLPSGAISVSVATKVGFGLLIGGVILALLASVYSFGIAIILGILVFLYDGPLKKTMLGPLTMGSCRTLNILLGASTAGSIPTSVIFYAIAIGVFVSGITWLARREAQETQSAATLWPGSTLMVLGMLLVGFAAWQFLGDGSTSSRFSRFFPVAFGFICLPIFRRMVLAIATASSQSVQTTVVTSLRSLIVFDACMGLLVENGRPVYSIVILSLLVASSLLGRFTKLT